MLVFLKQLKQFPYKNVFQKRVTVLFFNSSHLKKVFITSQKGIHNKMTVEQPLYKNYPGNRTTLYKRCLTPKNPLKDRTKKRGCFTCQIWKNNDEVYRATNKLVTIKTLFDQSYNKLVGSSNSFALLYAWQKCPRQVFALQKWRVQPLLQRR